jgi:hypothetical protein
MAVHIRRGTRAAFRTQDAPSPPTLAYLLPFTFLSQELTGCTTFATRAGDRNALGGTSHSIVTAAATNPIECGLSPSATCVCCLCAVCYPSTQAVAEHILRAQRRWGVRRVFLATDSPAKELFEDVLRQHGVDFARYGQQGLAPSLGAEFGLMVDQTMCASAPYFLGNVPSTVTATILQERDNIGWARERSDFFGFGEAETQDLKRTWVPGGAFTRHFFGPDGCIAQSPI